MIGGLVMSTFATLLILPSIFSLLIGQREARSPSLYPGNPESTHYDRTVFGGSNGSDQEDNGKENGEENESSGAAGH